MSDLPREMRLGPYERKVFSAATAPRDASIKGSRNLSTGQSASERKDVPMTQHDMLGYFASSLVLTTFWMRSMFGLRLMAIASNIAFITYALLSSIHPVLVLHLMLLPLNLWRIAPEVPRGIRWLMGTTILRTAAIVAKPLHLSGGLSSEESTAPGAATDSSGNTA